MEKLPMLSGDELIKILKKIGFEPVRQKGSHIDEDPLSDEAIHGIEEALADIKNGRLHTEEDIMKEFGLK